MGHYVVLMLMWLGTHFGVGGRNTKYISLIALMVKTFLPSQPNSVSLSFLQWWFTLEPMLIWTGKVSTYYIWELWPPLWKHSISVSKPGWPLIKASSHKGIWIVLRVSAMVRVPKVDPAIIGFLLVVLVDKSSRVLSYYTRHTIETEWLQTISQVKLSVYTTLQL